MQLVIKIKMGNEAMSNYAHIMQAISNSVSRFTCGQNAYTPAYRGDNGTLSDLNGNKVGTWEVSEATHHCTDCKQDVSALPMDDRNGPNPPTPEDGDAEGDCPVCCARLLKSERITD